ncbi:MAG: zinc ABC transporter substrate-binding protein [Bacillota bacterium]|nr:zinc ABC transporter substrate-binding protein [Bacillota bacterium]
MKKHFHITGFMILLLISLSILATSCSPVLPQEPEEPTENLPEETVVEEPESLLEASGPVVVASTSWVAYIAQAAGAENITILAPIELRHPPEYDFRPGDIQLVQEADWIIMAGYEPFMNRILEATEVEEDRVLRVRTTNTYENLSAQTALIAEALGTHEVQTAWVERLQELTEEMRQQAVEKQLTDQRILVHVHLEAFIRSLGIEPMAVYGAEEMSPAKMGELAAMNPDLILDNYHNPQGAGIQEISGAELIELRNFPTEVHEDLIDLLLENAALIGLY